LRKLTGVCGVWRKAGARPGRIGSRARGPSGAGGHVTEVGKVT
jgi:hypothetical protein